LLEHALARLATLNDATARQFRDAWRSSTGLYLREKRHFFSIRQEAE